ncbi:MAG: CDC27 family protein [Chthoniobacterales bacterium]|nr:CDC27 family protein [Chthoniobacterales bacterium]
MRKAVATNPSNALAQFRIGQTLLFQGKYEEALRVLRSVPKEVNPALVGHQIAFALFHLGRKEEASATLAQFLKIIRRTMVVCSPVCRRSSRLPTGKRRLQKRKFNRRSKREGDSDISIIRPITSPALMRSCATGRRPELARGGGR